MLVLIGLSLHFLGLKALVQRKKKKKKDKLVRPVTHFIIFDVTCAAGAFPPKL